MTEKKENTPKIVNQGASVTNIVLVGLFSAIIYVGIQFFRIPLPAAVGTPFIHFGNSLVVLAVLFLGFSKGAISGSIGLGVFDVLNGYASLVAITIIEVIIVAFLVALVFNLLGRNDQKSVNITIVAIVAGVTKIVLSFLEGFILLLLQGSGIAAATTSSFISLPAAIINSVSTIIIVRLLYRPIKKALTIFAEQNGAAY